MQSRFEDSLLRIRLGRPQNGLAVCLQSDTRYKVIYRVHGPIKKGRCWNWSVYLVLICTNICCRLTLRTAINMYEHQQLASTNQAKQRDVCTRFECRWFRLEHPSRAYPQTRQDRGVCTRAGCRRFPLERPSITRATAVPLWGLTTQISSRLSAILRPAISAPIAVIKSEAF